MSSGPSPGGPWLAVVFAADRYPTIRRMVHHLAAQSIADRLEIVVATADVEGFAPPADELAPFHAVRIIPIGSLASLRRAKAAGIRAARAPIVALAETHCFPDPGWAAAIVEAHEGPWAAVCPAIGNANPDSLIGWSNLLIDYGPWIHPQKGGEMTDLPANNTSYKRDVLLAFGDRLEELLEAETVLHAELRARGHRLRLEPAAIARHLNVARLADWLPERYYGARYFAGHRAESWSRARRAAYVLGSPLIPPLRLARVLARIARSGLAGRLLPGVLPALCVGLGASAVGETIGYVFGVGPTGKVTEWELHRADYSGDRKHAGTLSPGG